MRTYYIFLAGFLVIGFWLNCAASRRLQSTGVSSSSGTSSSAAYTTDTLSTTVTVDTSFFEVYQAKTKHTYVTPEVWRSILFQYGKELQQAKHILDTVLTLNETTYHLIQSARDSIP